MTGLIIFVLLGIGIGLFAGKIYKNNYGLARFSNCLLGITGALMVGSLAVVFSNSGLFLGNLNFISILAAAVGAFVFVGLASLLRGTQYE